MEESSESSCIERLQTMDLTIETNTPLCKDFAIIAIIKAKSIILGQVKNGMILEECIKLSKSDDLSYQDRVFIFSCLEKVCKNPTTDEEKFVAEGFAYWKAKFDRIPQCNEIAEIEKICEEYTFTDPEETRKKYNCCKYNVVQSAMRLTITALRSSLLDIQRTSDPRIAIERVLGVTFKIIKDRLMRQLSDRICQKHGFKDTEHYFEVMGIE